MNDNEKTVSPVLDQETTSDVQDPDETEVIDTVSSNDLYYYTVSQNDLMLTSLSDINDTLSNSTTDYLLTVIIFILLFSFCYDRVKNALSNLFK